MTGSATGSALGASVFSWVVFLLPALALTAPVGVGLIEAVILIASVIHARSLWSQGGALFKPARWIAFAFAFSLAASCASLLHSGVHLKFIDNPVRALLAVSAIGLIALTKPRAEWFWHGLFAGTTGALCIALYQRFEMGMPRAEGFQLAIIFGDVAMAMGILSLAGIQVFSKTRLAMLPYLAFLAGVSASILSGSRGGWIALILSSFPLYFHGRRTFGKKLLAAAALGFALLTAAYFIPQSSVRQRLDDVSADLYRYQLGDANTSVGARLEMWKAAWKMFTEHPLLGVGRANFNQGLDALIARGEISPAVADFRHAHNEIFDALATQGIIGAVALLLLYAAPFAFFMRSLRRDGSHQPYALAGLLLVLAFIDFGLTQVMFAHHVGSAFYAAAISVLAGICTMKHTEFRHG